MCITVSYSWLLSDFDVTAIEQAQETSVTLEQLLTKDLQDLYQVESELTGRLSQFEHDASNSDLKDALQDHIGETQQHVERLQEVLEQLGETAGGSGEVPAAVQALIAEGTRRISEQDDPGFRDFAVIASAQKVEHYEIACYGIARAMAHTIGLMDAARLLQDTLSEEKQADERLSRVALVLLKQLGQKEPSQV